MKQQVLFIHGGSSYSNYDAFLRHLSEVSVERVIHTGSKRWTEGLKNLPTKEWKVFMPKMPNSENSRYEEWKIWFERHFEVLHDRAILIGWSQGGLFLVKYLIENDVPFDVGNLFLIATPSYYFVSDTGEDGGDFNFDINQLQKVATQVKNIHIYHSKDDFVVPYEHALKYKEALPKATLHTFEDRNHFLQEEFPELIEEIQKT